MHFQIHSDSTNAAINLLTRVSGIGPAKAHSLVKDGITTLEELKNIPISSLIIKLLA